ncbi:MAG: large-conductance mechanosensitive channel protein MscL [Candidatus Omnitrophica bacterium]|nr:large-conductance mechanosensitive channel protein MscL [Candidatus Omnitrophota bacterium]
MNIVQEFKAFALRGNIIDMAVGIIIGAGFGKIVDSAVKDVLMPPLGFIVGGIDFSNLEIVLRQAAGTVPAVTVKYGLFLNAMISFTIVAFAVFMLIRGINALQKKEAAQPSVPALPSKEELLLTEIRDLLKRNN